jgi:hypothetical protein
MLSSSPSKIHEPRVTGVSPRPTTSDSARKLRNTRAQAVRTARVSCGVACSGHGLRNLAAMMTRRSLMAMSS